MAGTGPVRRPTVAAIMAAACSWRVTMSRIRLLWRKLSTKSRFSSPAEQGGKISADIWGPATRFSNCEDRARLLFCTPQRNQPRPRRQHALHCALDSWAKRKGDGRTGHPKDIVHVLVFERPALAAQAISGPENRITAERSTQQRVRARSYCGWQRSVLVTQSAPYEQVAGLHRASQQRHGRTLRLAISAAHKRTHMVSFLFALPPNREWGACKLCCAVCQCTLLMQSASQ